MRGNQTVRMNTARTDVIFLRRFATCARTKLSNRCLRMKCGCAAHKKAQKHQKRGSGALRSVADSKETIAIGALCAKSIRWRRLVECPLRRLCLRSFCFCAFEFVRVVHGAHLTATAFGNCFRAFHHERAAFFADSAGRLCLDGELAIRVIGTCVEEAKAPATLQHLAVHAARLYAFGAHDPSLALRFVALHEFAFRIARAGDEYPEASFALCELALFAFGARLAETLRRLHDAPPLPSPAA